MADDTVIGSERAYRMFSPDPGLYGTDVIEDPFSSAGKEIQTFHLVTYILQLSDELSPLYGYFCDTSLEDHLPRSIDDIIHNLPIRDLEGETMNYNFNGREVTITRFEMGILRAVVSFIQYLLYMVPAETYRQLQSSDKQVWKSLSDEGKAAFIKFLSKAPTTEENDNTLSRKEIGRAHV